MEKSKNACVNGPGAIAAFLLGKATGDAAYTTKAKELFLWERATLFDPMTLVFVLRPELCPVTGMHIRVDEKGFTREEPGTVNAQVCLDSNGEDFFKFYLKRVAGDARSQ